MESTGDESMSSKTDLLLDNSIFASSLEIDVSEVWEYPWAPIVAVSTEKISLISGLDK